MLLWPCVILRQPDTHMHSLKALTTTADTRNRFRIRGSIRPEKKYEKKVFSLHPQREGIRDPDDPFLRTGHTRAHTHTHARTRRFLLQLLRWQKDLGIPDFPPDDDSVPQ